MNKIQKLFSEDIRKSNIKPLSDKELTKLLYQAKYGETEEERKKARQQIVLHLLPIIISKCKKFFPENYVIENTDFINEVILYLLEAAIDNYRLEEQEGDRCALFFRMLSFAILFAYRNLKKKYFGAYDVKYKDFINPKAKEFSSPVKEDVFCNYYNEENFDVYDYLSDVSHFCDEGFLETTSQKDFLYCYGEELSASFQSLFAKEIEAEFYSKVLPESDLVFNLAFFIEKGVLQEEDYKRNFRRYFSRISKRKNLIKIRL